jgi:hypothetical protein
MPLECIYLMCICQGKGALGGVLIERGPRCIGSHRLGDALSMDGRNKIHFSGNQKLASFPQLKVMGGVSFFPILPLLPASSWSPIGISGRQMRDASGHQRTFLPSALEKTSYDQEHEGARPQSIQGDKKRQN